MKRVFIATIFIVCLNSLHAQYGGYTPLNGTNHLDNNSTQGVFTDATYNDGAITSTNSATVHFVGSVPNSTHQILSYTGTALVTQIGNAVLENGTGGLFINDAPTGLEITTNFNFNGQNGQVITLRDTAAVAANNLHIDANATISGADASNNVNGYLKKDGDANAFDFPLADGTTYGPMHVGIMGAGKSIVAAYYHSSPASASAFQNGPFTLTSVNPAYIEVSSTEYWNVISTGSPVADLSLTFRGDYSSSSLNTVFLVGWNNANNQWELIPNQPLTGLTPGNTISSSGTVNFSNYSAFTIGFILPPIVAATSTPENCSLKNASITATGTKGVPPYQFSLDGTNFQTGNIFGGLPSGNYKIYIEDSYGLKDTADVNLQNIPAGAISAGNNINAAINEPVQLNVIDVSGQGYNQFNWSPPDGLNNTAIQNPIATLDKNVTYTVTAIAPNGCEATTTITVKVFPGPAIYVPNAFTPNGDGKNDILRAIPIGLKTFSYFAVYNRWGGRIFYTKDAGIGWDGIVGGSIQTADTYVWVAEGVDNSGKKIIRKGTVTLIR